MSNDFYNRTEELTRNTAARSRQINREFAAVQSGFEKLPPLSEINSGAITFYEDTGTAPNAYILADVTGPTTPTRGTSVSFFAASANTGTATLKYGAWDAKALRRLDGSELLADDIRAGQLVEARYRGAFWVINSTVYGETKIAEDAAAAALASEQAAANSETVAIGRAAAAGASETNAADSEAAALGAASSASTSAAAALASKNAAEASEAAASGSETAASGSASAAAASRTAAENAQTAAEAARGRAVTAETNSASSEASAAGSATSAASSAAAASDSASDAASSKTSASGSATSAAGSASAASTSANNAANSALAAENWATDTNVVNVGTNIGPITTVAANLPAVQNVSDNMGAVAALGSSVPNMNAVAAISGDVTTVANISGDITAIASQLGSQVTDLMGDVSLDMILTSKAGMIAPDLYFTRASTGTYFDSRGVLRTAAIDEPRFDHDPMTGLCRGLAIERQSTNLCTYSEDFSHGSWLKVRTDVTSNAAIAPDGTQSADRLTENSETGAHYAYKPIALTAGTRHTASCHVNPDGRTVAQLFCAGSSPAWVLNVDLITGQVTGAVDADIERYKIKRLRDGTYRISATWTTATGGTNNIGVGLSNGSPSTSNFDTWTGDGVSGAEIWGFQVEEGYLSSYIKTEAVAVTRSADVYAITDLGWYDVAGGTIYCEVEFSETFDYDTAWAFDDGTSGNQIRYIKWNNGYDRSLYIIKDAAPESVGLTAAMTGSVRYAGAFFENDVIAYKNGSQAFADDSAAMPSSLSRFDVGSTLGSFQLDGHIKRLIYSKTRVPNATLEAITS